MVDRPILKTHANAAFEAIVASGLDPSEFEWRMVNSEKTGDVRISELLHRPTGFYFRFDFNAESHFTVRAPGENAPYDTRSPGNWSNQFGYFEEWVRNIKAEYLAPNLWATVTVPAALQQGDPREHVANDAFTEAELPEVHRALEEIARYARATFGLQEDQQAFLQTRLTYLEDAARRQGRLDWLFAFVGVFATIVTGLALSPAQGRDLWHFTVQVLRTIGQFKGFLP